MTAKNSTIKFLTLSSEKEQADKIALQLNLKKQEFYEAVFHLGLQQLAYALLNGFPIEVQHDINSSCKRISVQKKNRKNT